MVINGRLHQPEILDSHPETVYGQAYESAPLQLNFAYPYFSFDLTSIEIDPLKKSRKMEEYQAPKIFKRTWQIIREPRCWPIKCEPNPDERYITKKVATDSGFEQLCPGN